jgi:hypothetical protein
MVKPAEIIDKTAIFRPDQIDRSLDVPVKASAGICLMIKR